MYESVGNEKISRYIYKVTYLKINSVVFLFHCTKILQQINKGYKSFIEYLELENNGL